MKNHSCLTNILYLVRKQDNWQLLLQKRQHKFVQSLLRNEANLRSVAMEFGYTEADMLSIFSRIERTLHQSYQRQSHVEKSL